MNDLLNIKNAVILKIKKGINEGTLNLVLTTNYKGEKNGGTPDIKSVVE